jgi:hypothetical protein
MTERYGSGRMPHLSDEPLGPGDVLGRVRRQLHSALVGVVTLL